MQNLELCWILDFLSFDEEQCKVALELLQLCEVVELCRVRVVEGYTK